MRLPNALMSLVSSTVIAGCTAESLPEEEFVDAADEAVTTDNALTQNALTQNALTQNALTQNALTQNALTQNALTAIRDPGSQGEINRTFLRYTVACAFRPNQFFTFSRTDSENVVRQEQYFGQLGIAPHWRHGVLGEKGKRMVTACLAAKVNFYGAQVTLSVRSGENPLRLHPWSNELDDFPNIEGAFWGNLWADEPFINACYKTSNIDNSRAYLRECAAGHLNPDGSIEECGIINIVGPCSAVCKNFNPATQHYGQCREKPGQSNKFTKEVITTALP